MNYLSKIPVVILAGGKGTRLQEETTMVPKPLVEIGEMPIIWHIMKIYSHYGFNDFIICCGYKGHLIKQYFKDYYFNNCDISLSLGSNKLYYLNNNKQEHWNITCIDTGQETMTGGRIKRIKTYIESDNFLCTYGDGVIDVNINDLFKFHLKNNKVATMTSVQPPAKFGTIEFNDNRTVRKFKEKEKEKNWINGGFFVLNKRIFDYIEDDKTIFEKEPLEKLVEDNELSAYRHEGNWGCMDTVYEKDVLEKLWKENPFWKVWEN